MAAGAFFPHGTTVTFNGIGVGGLLDIPLPQLTKEEVETTAHGDFTRSYVPGLTDSGTISIPARLIPDDPGQVELWENLEAEGNTNETVVILTPFNEDGKAFQLTFQAYVSGIDGNLPWEGSAAGLTFNLRVTSKPERVVVDEES
jgi:hypothetical protein